jgi:Type II secretory pathway, component PulK
MDAKFLRAKKRGTMVKKNEKGVALILTLILLAVLSVMAVSLLFMAQAETWSGMNYRMMTQARYGAEAGVHSAANFIQSTAYTPPTAAQIAANFNTSATPVTYGSGAATLSANSSLGSTNYPISSDVSGFSSNATGSLTAGNTTVNYGAYARLLAVQSFTTYPSTLPGVVEKWEITSDGTINGVRNAKVRVSAIMERQKNPSFAYAAFATAATCSALSFGGGGTTNSYDSSAISYDSKGNVVTQAYGGNVGTNGNLDMSGSKTTINGSLSTPRAGTGTCSTSTVTALSANGNATVTGGITELPQNVSYDTPPAPSPAPPTTSMDIKKSASCPISTNCTASGSITQIYGDGTASGVGSSSNPILLGNVSMNAQADLHFAVADCSTAGTPVYININTISTNGNSTITIDPIKCGGTTTTTYPQIILNFAGAGSTTPIDLTGSSLTNPTLNPAYFQMLYAGTGQVTLNGGSAAAGLLYAPNASFKLNGGGDWYGAVVAQQITDLGGGAIHYDRRLQKEFYQLGKYMLSSFNWQKY